MQINKTNKQRLNSKRAEIKKLRNRLKPWAKKQFKSVGGGRKAFCRWAKNRGIDDFSEGSIDNLLNGYEKEKQDDYPINQLENTIEKLGRFEAYVNEYIVEKKSTGKIENHNHHLIKNELEKKILFDYFWEASINNAKNKKNGVYELVNEETFIIHGSEISTSEIIQEFWLQATICSTISWYCTTYIFSSEDWGTNNWLKEGLEYHKINIDRNDAKIRRVFIFDNEKEKGSYYSEKLIQSNLKYNIKIQTTTKKAFVDKHINPIQDLKNELGTADLAIIDNKYLCLFFHQDGKRDIEYIKCTANKGIIQQARKLYEALWANTDGASALLGSTEETSFSEIVIKYALPEEVELPSKDEINNFWLTCIESSKRSWKVTNYANSKIYWDESYPSNRIEQIQRLKTREKEKQDILRLFIFDTEDEKKFMLNKMKKQINDKILVRWIYKDVIDDNDHFRADIEVIGTEDFGIVDDEWVFQFFLKDRTIDNCVATRNKRTLNLANDLFRNLWLRANVVK